MRKLIRLPELSDHFEPTIQIVRAGEYNRHEKTASEALEYIKQVKPELGKTSILVLAMTASDYFGPNRNGDAWHENPTTLGGGAHLTKEESLPAHYKTFETDGNIFKFHCNKNPANRLGEVLKAFYNWKMHRVELLLSLLNRQAEDIVEKIEKGEFPAVSMGCFLAGTLVTMADGIRKPIECIEVGDAVLTHKGNIKKVTQAHKRPYKGAIYGVKPSVYSTILCTEEHPFWATSRENLRKKNDKATFRWDPEAVPAPDWTHAKCLEEGQHYLFEPIITEVATPDYVRRSFARLFGYYLADGHIIRNKNKEVVAISLCVNKHNPILSEISLLCQDFGTKNPPNIYPKPNSDECLTIDIYDRELASLCLEHGGAYGRYKRLSYSATRWDPEMQKEMLGAYANSDGCGLKTGALSLSTASPNLAWQLVAVLHRLGALPSINNLEHKAGSGFNTTNTTEWVIHIGKQWAQSFRSVCAKVVPSEVLAARNDRMIFENQIATPIREIVSEWAETDVYNLEVESDESYVAGGVSVHNCKVKFDVCSVCSNKAPTREQYCDHAKWQLGQLLSNGKRVCVWNPSPKFFDISMVRKPADRVAYMMKKVAEESAYEIQSSAELGEHLDWTENKLAELGKLSLIQKVINGNAVALKDDDGLTPDSRAIENFCSQVAVPAAQTMPRFSDDTIRQLIEHHPTEVLATLSQMGILLTTPEFIKYFTWRLDPSVKIPQQALENAVALQAKIFSLLSRKPEILDEIHDSQIFEFGSNNVSEKVATILNPYMEKRSQYSSYLYRHAVPGVLKGIPTQGNYDVLDTEDPNTGRQFQTTRGAQRAAEDVAVERRTKNMLGGAAMLAGGAWLGLRPSANAVSRIAGGGLAGLGLVHGAQRFGQGYYGYPSVKARTGEDVYLRAPYGPWYDRPYRGTELVEKRSYEELLHDSSYESLEKHASIRAAMEACQYPGSRVRMGRFHNWEIKAASLDEAAQILGEVILL